MSVPSLPVSPEKQNAAVTIEIKMCDCTKGIYPMMKRGSSSSTSNKSKTIEVAQWRSGLRQMSPNYEVLGPSPNIQ